MRPMIRLPVTLRIGDIKSPQSRRHSGPGKLW
jgi:hypothetical protein